MCPLIGCGMKKPPEPPESLFPKKIENLKARVVEGCAAISWSYPGTATPEKILVLRREASDPDSKWTDPEQIAELKGEAAFYSDCAIKPGKFYSYQALAVSKFSEPSPEAKEALVSVPALPGLPEGLKVIPGDRFVDLQWAAKADASYNLYRSDDPNKPAEKPVNPVPINGSKFSDIGLDNGKTYYYCLREAIIPKEYPPVEGPCAKASAEPIDLIAPMPPKGLAVVLMPGGVLLKWFKSPEPDLRGYLVFRRSAGAQYWKQLTPAPIGENEYLDSSALSQHGKWEYGVRAVDNAPANNVSELTGPATITLP